ncbi:hypothetical protein GCM10009785_11820 [Brooklawnia cerclae]|uniref:Uncharacterized protein n=1 Tax=Brooklawnia cerclae TaxID=349934 RepID=A0ABX0SKQ1_9ACTN|nr:hypothetical protein [Brooklawnia cerclae]NIH58591.1 hypothetical protein [Brooklawnia cerclae]
MPRRIRTRHPEEDAQGPLDPHPAPGSVLEPVSPRLPRLELAVARLLPARVQGRWLNRTERNVTFARVSIVTSLLMAVWKIIVAVVATASLFWLTNAAFSIGLAIVKYIAVSAHQPGRPGRPPRAPEVIERRQHIMYRATGAGIIVLAVVYIAGCLTMVLNGGQVERYDDVAGITIAAVTFTELGMALYGVFAARRDSDLVVEMIKLSNLAGAFVLLVLTQSALLSFSYSESTPQYTGLGGIAFGVLAGAIGVYMLTRRLPTATRLPELTR